MPTKKHSQEASRDTAPTAAQTASDESIRLAQRSNQLQVYSLGVSILSLLVTVALTIIIFSWTTTRQTAQLQLLAMVNHVKDTDRWTTTINFTNMGPARAENLDIKVWYNAIQRSTGNAIDPKSLRVCCPDPIPEMRLDDKVGIAIVGSQNMNAGDTRAIGADIVMAEPLNSTLEHQYFNAGWDSGPTMSSAEYKDFLTNFIIQVYVYGQYVVVKDSNIRLIAFQN